MRNCPLGQWSFVACRLSPSQDRPNGRRLPGEAKPIRRCVPVNVPPVERTGWGYPEPIVGFAGVCDHAGS